MRTAITVYRGARSGFTVGSERCWWTWTGMMGRFCMVVMLCLSGPVLAGWVAWGQESFRVRVCLKEALTLEPMTSTSVEVRSRISSDQAAVTAGDGCVQFVFPLSVGTDDDPVLSEAFTVGQPYPNPSADRVVVPFALAHTQEVTFALFDLMGRSVIPAVRRSISGGWYGWSVGLEGLASGIYVYRLSGEAGVATGRFVRVAGSHGGAVPVATLLPLQATPGPAVPHAGAMPAGKSGEVYEIRVIIRAAGFQEIVDQLEVEDGDTLNYFPRPEGMGVVPISDMKPLEAYIGFSGGLYPDVSNLPPPAHDVAGLEHASRIEPLDTAGNPNPAGKYVLMSLGMSNTTQEFCKPKADDDTPCNTWTFMGQAAADPAVNTASLVIVNGALGGQSAPTWAPPFFQNYDRIRDEVLEPMGLSEQQVQAVWIKVANPAPTVALPDPAADAYVLEAEMGEIIRTLKMRYPNVQQVFLSSRIYAGYAASTLNPEPYAYESGFAVKWLVEAQIEQVATGATDPVAGDLDYQAGLPWLGWGPYLWANGTTPRSDGLVWVEADFEGDGTHPGRTAEEKVGSMLLDFFKNAPYTRCWFVKDGVCGD